MVALGYTGAEAGVSYFEIAPNTECESDMRWVLSSDEVNSESTMIAIQEPKLSITRNISII